MERRGRCACLALSNKDEFPQLSYKFGGTVNLSSNEVHVKKAIAKYGEIYEHVSGT
jgi:hypothetical protein